MFSLCLGFYVTYFWASAIVFPVVLGGTLLTLYFCLIRRPKGQFDKHNLY